MSRLGSSKPGHKYLRRKTLPGGKHQYIYHENKGRDKAAPEEQKATPPVPAEPAPQPSEVKPYTTITARPASSYLSPDALKGMDDDQRAWFRGTSMPTGFHAMLFGSGWIRKVTSTPPVERDPDKRPTGTNWVATYLPKPGAIEVHNQPDMAGREESWEDVTEATRRVTGIAMERYCRVNPALQKYASIAPAWKEAAEEMREKLNLPTESDDNLWSMAFSQYARAEFLESDVTDFMMKCPAASSFMASIDGATYNLMPNDYSPELPASVEDVDVYEPQATEDAAARWCEDVLNIPMVKFRGLTPETANAIARGMFDDVKACGPMKLRSFVTHGKDSVAGGTHTLISTSIANAHLENGSWMEANIDELKDYTPRPRKLHDELTKLATGTQRDVSESTLAVIAQIPADAQLGYTIADMSPTVDGAIEALMTHECGHARMNVASAKVQKVVQDMYDTVTNSSSTISYDGVARINTVVKHLNEFPSEYSLSNWKEYGSECYAAWRTGICRERVPQELIDLFEKTFKVKPQDRAGSSDAQQAKLGARL